MAWTRDPGPGPVGGTADHPRPDRRGGAERRTGARDPFPRPGRADRWPLLLLVAVILGCAALVGAEHPSLSPIDEAQHYDYVTRLVHDHRVPRLFEAYSVSTDRVLACYGPAPWNLPPPPCDAPDAQLRDWGRIYTTAGGYPPVYYLGTAAAAVVLEPVAGNLFTAARLASALWLALGAVATYLLCRTAGSGRTLAFGLTAGTALAPLMLFQGSTVNPDATSMLIGPGAVLAWLRLRGRSGWRPAAGLVLVLAAAPLIKPNLMPVPLAIAAAELSLQAYTRGPAALFRRETWSRRTASGRVVLAAVLAVLPAAVWSAAFMVFTHPANPVRRSAADGNQPWNTVAAVRSLVGAAVPLSTAPTFRPLDGAVLTLLATLLGWAAIAGALAGSLLSADRDPGLVADLGGVRVDPARAISFAALWSLALAAPVTYALLVLSGRFFPYQGRYSLWAVPLGLAALSGLVGRRRGLLLATLGLAAAALTGVELLRALPG